jgi:hypothetical protein
MGTESSEQQRLATPPPFGTQRLKVVSPVWQFTTFVIIPRGPALHSYNTVTKRQGLYPTYMQLNYMKSSYMMTDY